MLIYEKRVYHWIHVPSTSSAKSVNIISLLNSLLWVVLYIFHGEKIHLNSKEDVGPSKYFPPLKNIG